MPATLAFDVYGTLIDTHGVVTALRAHVGERAPAFSQLWREKQLEYTFRRGLMQHYAPFPVCVAEALDYCCARFDLVLEAAQREALLGVFADLPAFPDAAPGLAAAAAAGMRLFAFSNGTAAAVDRLLEGAGLRASFIDVVSCDEVMSFKPNPGVYAHFLRRAGVSGQAAWLVSGNPFDAMGAISAGMQAAWVHRPGGPAWDPWGIAPTVTVPDLVTLAEAIAAA